MDLLVIEFPLFDEEVNFCIFPRFVIVIPGDGLDVLPVLRSKVAIVCACVRERESV
jgi:hypothetical protein